ncbi:MAG: MFS transporter [Rhodospirillaceae bacterium]|nr:MFS transporter [Rhodospirillaceae bacterium]|tara:strand:+ start:22631 stop:23899 length:1269 start_codon:yes stop_codon:yes gene_type:complete
MDKLKIMDKKSTISWALYDWANQAFFTLIITFVFATYVSNSVANSIDEGTAMWGTAISISFFTVAILAPILGAISDKKGNLKPWIGFFTYLCVISTALLWFIEPKNEYLFIALILVAIANFGGEFATVFYNALLTEVSSKNNIGKISGWAWGLGYAGGILCLVISLVFFVLPDTPPFGLDKTNSEEIRVTALLVAIWFAIFSTPLFLFTKDRKQTTVSYKSAISDGLKSTISTIKNFSKLGEVGRFLIARMIYTDGINTVFVMGGIYAAGTFGMDFQEILIFGILINVTAGIGAAVFAWIDDYIGSKKTIIISLLALIVLGTLGCIVESKDLFYLIGAGLGIFIGPIQSSSRSLMARLTPDNKKAEFFGLYSLSGKITTFLGPLVFGWVTILLGSQRYGMATVIIFLLIGLIILIPLKNINK